MFATLIKEALAPDKNSKQRKNIFIKKKANNNA